MVLARAGVLVCESGEQLAFQGVTWPDLFQAYASKEVILSGGAINSPQLLMLSGIGNADDLKKLGIPVVCHLPGEPPSLLLPRGCFCSTNGLLYLISMEWGGGGSQ